MKVKTALIVSGACIIFGEAMFFFVTPWWAQALTWDEANIAMTFSFLMIPIRARAT